MVGPGAFVGYGAQVNYSHSKDPLPTNLSINGNPFVEAGGGNGPVSYSINVPLNSNGSPAGVGSGVGRFGEGIGLYAGVGGAASFNFATPTLGQIYDQTSKFLDSISNSSGTLPNASMSSEFKDSGTYNNNSTMLRK